MTNIANFNLNYDNEILDKAKRYFNLTLNLDYKDTSDGLELNTETWIRLQTELENLILDYGAKNVLDCLFYRLKSETYRKETNRFDFVYYKSECRKKGIIPIPYRYLINLCSKKISVKRKQPFGSIEKIIEYSRYILVLLGCFNNNIFSDNNISDLKDLPKLVYKSMKYDSMCQLPQYDLDFIEELINDILLPLSKDKTLVKELPLLKSRSFYEVFIKLIRLTNNSFIDINTFRKSFNCNKSIILSSLDFFSIDIGEVNADYQKPFDKENLFGAPLIKLDNENYFFISSSFFGYAFFERIFNELYSNLYVSKSMFNLAIGHKIEKYVYHLLDKKNFNYSYGKYNVGKVTFECDLILENDKSLFFIEIKKKKLVDEFYSAELDVVLNELANNGLLSAEKQALHHVLELTKNSQLQIENDTGKKCIQIQNRRLFTMSIGLSEYLFFTYGLISYYLTQASYCCEFNTTNGQNASLEAINRLCANIQNLIKEYKAVNLKEIAVSNSFRSMQQFWYTIKESNDNNELIELLSKSVLTIFTNADFYSQIKYLKKLYPNNES